LITNEKIKLVIAINEFSIAYSKLSGTLREMEGVVESSFYNNQNRILTIRDSVVITPKLDEKLLGRAMNNIINSMLDKQTDYCMHELKKLFDLLNDRHYSLNLVFQFMNDMIARMKFVLGEAGIELDNTDISILEPNKLHNISMLYEHIQCSIKRVIKKQEESSFNMNVRIEIRKAIEYISENYQLNITLEEVANHVGLSKNHFCRLFKNELEDNFVSYVNKFRIQKAKFLMEHTNQKIKEIAVNVGLSDYRYFCKIFKETEQITPTDYKKYLENNTSQYNLAQYNMAQSNLVQN
jgi:YesN/AraC family two-component response regulator